MRANHRTPTLLLTAALVVMAGPATAAPVKEPPPPTPDARSGATVWDEAMKKAKAEFDKGQKAYFRADFRIALQYYRNAYELKKLPALLFNIAQCHRQLGEYKKARFFYKLYLSEKPKAANRQETERRIREMEAKLAAKTKAEATPPPKPFVPYHKRWWFWTGLATAAVLGGVAVGTGVKALQMQKQWNDSQGQPNVSYDFRARSKALRITTDALLGAAGAVALTTIIAAVVVTHRGKRDRRTATRLLPSCGPGGCSLTLTGRF